MNSTTAVKLKPVVRFREFPFGTADDPSMQASMQQESWPDQDKVLEYLRAGHVLALPMGASLTDWLDRPQSANVVIGGQVVGGTTPMTDGVWFWYAGLIHFIEKYNVRVSEEFLAHAARHHWQVDAEALAEKPCDYEYSYFDESV